MRGDSLRPHSMRANSLTGSIRAVQAWAVSSMECRDPSSLLQESLQVGLAFKSLSRWLAAASFCFFLGGGRGGRYVLERLATAGEGGGGVPPPPFDPLPPDQDFTVGK